MDIKRPDLEKAKNTAGSVLRDNLIAKPPVDAKKIAQGFGLRVTYGKFKEGYENIAGFIVIDDKKIVVNDDDPIYCQNFTIAHELGHFVLMHDMQLPKYSYLFRDRKDQVKTPEENEANYFAANLLVPQRMLQEWVTRFSFATNQQLSEIFGVPEYVIELQKFYR